MKAVLFKRLLSASLAIIFIFCSVYTGSAALGSSCGENASWSFDEASGVLTVSGSGEMADYASVSETPWKSISESITGVVIENGITRIGNCAFKYCTGLNSVSLPESLVEIGDFSFAYCSGIRNIAVPPQTERIGNGSFLACIWLESVSLGDKLISIGDGAFDYCIRLKSIELSESLENIGDYAFYCCVGISEITIPQNVSSIGSECFKNCLLLKKITVINNEVSLDNSGLGLADNIYTEAGSDELSQHSLEEAASEIRELKADVAVIREKSAKTENDYVAVDGIEIAGYEGSTAVQYAENFGFTVSVTGCEHETELINSKAATCTEDGYTGDYYCTKCKKIITQGTVIPHKGHSFGEYVYNDDATIYSNGTKTAKCLFCEETNTVEAENTQIRKTVSFYVDGEPVLIRSYCYGEKIILPDNPLKEHYSFKGWSPVPDTASDTDLRFDAVFELTVYTVKFIADGNIVKEVEYTYGTAEIEEPAVPPIAGGFDGHWSGYSLSDGGNIAVYAVYSPAKVLAPAQNQNHPSNGWFAQGL